MLNVPIQLLLHRCLPPSLTPPPVITQPLQASRHDTQKPVAPSIHPSPPRHAFSYRHHPSRVPEHLSLNQDPRDSPRQSEVLACTHAPSGVHTYTLAQAACMSARLASDIGAQREGDGATRRKSTVAHA